MANSSPIIPALLKSIYISIFITSDLPKKLELRCRSLAFLVIMCFSPFTPFFQLYPNVLSFFISILFLCVIPSVVLKDWGKAPHKQTNMGSKHFWWEIKVIRSKYTVQQFSGSKIIQKRHIVVLIGFCALIPNLGSKLKSYERFSHNSRKNRGKSIFCGFSYKKYKETRYRHSDFFNWKNIILGSYCKRKNEKKLKIGLLAEF